jgi:hypothetical protein
MANDLLRRMNKLRKMSAAEIACRASRAARSWRERYAYKSRGRRVPAAAVAPLAAGTFCQQALQLVPGGAREELSRLVEVCPGLASRLEARSVSRARQIAGGSVSLLGHDVSLVPRVDWHRDPRTGHRFPRSFHGSVDLCQTSGDVDVKYVWELNRHQFVVDLARGWAFTREPHFA